MMNCGYEPSAALGIGAQPGDTWKTIKFNFGPKPAGTPNADVEAFNGVTAGKGHLTGSKTAAKPAEFAS